LPEKILLVRNDRIGDLVLTTPAIAAVGKSLPGARIDLLCSSSAEAVVRGNPYVNEVLTDRGANDSSDLKELVERIRQRRYDCAVVLVNSLKNARLVRRAGIPLRVGPLVRWYAPLYFNRVVRQKRSLAEKSEAVYSLDLLAPLGVKAGKLPPVLVIPTPGALSRAGELLCTIFDSGPDLPLLVIHPGMGGSALNWPEERWSELVGLLAQSGKYRVLVTGSESETWLAARVCSAAANNSLVRNITGISLEDFIGLLSLASGAAAPSTGPLHLATATGVPVAAGIYSPVRAQHPRRWGPLGKGRCKIFLPDVECPGKLDCLGSRCELFPCMGRIRARAVFDYLDSTLSRPGD